MTPLADAHNELAADLPDFFEKYVDERPGRRLARELGLPEHASRSWAAMVDLCIQEHIVFSLLRKGQAGCTEEGEALFASRRRWLAKKVLGRGEALASSRQEWLDAVKRAEGRLKSCAERYDIPLGERSAIELDDMEVVFVGEFSSGKSSLINAWLGTPDLLPTDNNVTTPCETRIRRIRDGETVGMKVTLSSEAELRRRLNRWLAEELPVQAKELRSMSWEKVAKELGKLIDSRSSFHANIAHWRKLAYAASKLERTLWKRKAPPWLDQLPSPADMPTWVDEEHLDLHLAAEELGKLRVREEVTWASLINKIEVRLDRPDLPKGVVIVDSPGAGSHDPSHVERAVELLQRAHAAVFVAGFDRPETEGLTQLVRAFRRASRDALPAIVAVNKVDQARSQAKLDETVRRVRSLLEDNGLQADPFPVSAESVLSELRGDDESSATPVDKLFEDFVSFRLQVEQLLVRAEQFHAHRRAMDKTRERVDGATKIVRANLFALRNAEKQGAELQQALEAARSGLTKWSPDLASGAFVEAGDSSRRDLEDAIQERMLASLEDANALRGRLPSFMVTVLAGEAADAALLWYRRRLQVLWDDHLKRRKQSVVNANECLQRLLAPLAKLGLDVGLEKVTLHPPAWSRVEDEVVPSLFVLEGVADATMERHTSRIAGFTRDRARVLKGILPELAKALESQQVQVQDGMMQALHAYESRCMVELDSVAKTATERVRDLERSVAADNQEVSAKRQALTAAKRELTALAGDLRPAA